MTCCRYGSLLNFAEAHTHLTTQVSRHGFVPLLNSRLSLRTDHDCSCALGTYQSLRPLICRRLQNLARVLANPRDTSRDVNFPRGGAGHSNFSQSLCGPKPCDRCRSALPTLRTKIIAVVTSCFDNLQISRSVEDTVHTVTVSRKKLAGSFNLLTNISDG